MRLPPSRLPRPLHLSTAAILFVAAVRRHKNSCCWFVRRGSLTNRQETLALSAAALVCLAASLPLIESVGRRKLYLICAAGSAVASALLAGSFAVEPDQRNVPQTILMALSVAGEAAPHALTRKHKRSRPGIACRRRHPARPP